MGRVMGLRGGGGGGGLGWRRGVGFCRSGWRSCLGIEGVGGIEVRVEGIERGGLVVGLEEVWLGGPRVPAADLDSRCCVSLTIVAKTSVEALIRDE